MKNPLGKFRPLESDAASPSVAWKMGSWFDVDVVAATRASNASHAGWLDSDGVRLRGRGRAGVGSQGTAGQEGIALVEALEMLSWHLLVLCTAQAAVARIRQTQAELYQN